MKQVFLSSKFRKQNFKRESNELRNTGLQRWFQAFVSSFAGGGNCHQKRPKCRTNGLRETETKNKMREEEVLEELEQEKK